MKVKLLLFAFCTLAMFTLFYSCNKNDTTPPAAATLTFEPDTASFEGFPGDVWSFTVSATAPSGFDSLYIEKQVGTGTPTIYASVTNATDNSATYNFSYTLSEDEVGETVTFTFTLVETGTNGLSATKTVVTDSPPARSYAAFLLYSPTGDKTSETWFSSNTGATYSSDSVITSTSPLSKDIDFGYYYLNSTGASIASPSAYPSSIYNLGANGQKWGTLNATNFRTTTMSESSWTELYGAPTMKEIGDAYDGGTDVGPNLTQLEKGKVYAFETDAAKDGGSKKGLFFVEDLLGTVNSNGYIQLQVVVQEPASE